MFYRNLSFSKDFGSFFAIYMHFKFSTSSSFYCMFDKIVL